MNNPWLLRLLLVVCALLLSSCKDDSKTNAEGQASVSGTSITNAVVLTQIDINNYILVSSRRVGRTVSEYTLRAIATNNSSTRYTNVTATLISAPSNITIVDNTVVFGTVVGNADTTSADEFIITVNLSVKTSLNDLVWQVNGTVPSTGGGGGSPDQPGIFMSIDDNSVIKGDATSKSHENWIVLQSFSEGSSLLFESSPGTTRPTGEINLDGVAVSKLLDSSSPLLRRAITEGDIFTEVKIDIIKLCDTTLYTAYAITLTVSALASLEMMSSGTGAPFENLRFDYSRIETMFTPVGPGCKFEAPVYSFQDAPGTRS